MLRCGTPRRMVTLYGHQTPVANVARGEQEELARKFSFVRSMRKQGITIVVVAAVVTAVLAYLSLALPSGGGLPAWVILAALGGYIPSTVTTLTRLRRLGRRVEGGLELLVAEKVYRTVLLQGNMIFAGVFLFLAMVALVFIG